MAKSLRRKSGTELVERHETAKQRSTQPTQTTQPEREEKSIWSGLPSSREQEKSIWSGLPSSGSTRQSQAPAPTPVSPSYQNYLNEYLKANERAVLSQSVPGMAERYQQAGERLQDMASNPTRQAYGARSHINPQGILDVKYNDSRRFARTMGALRDVGVTPEEYQAIIGITPKSTQEERIEKTRNLVQADPQLMQTAIHQARLEGYDGGALDQSTLDYVNRIMGAAKRRNAVERREGVEARQKAADTQVPAWAQEAYRQGMTGEDSPLRRNVGLQYISKDGREDGTSPRREYARQMQDVSQIRETGVFDSTYIDQGQSGQAQGHWNPELLSTQGLHDYRDQLQARKDALSDYPDRLAKVQDEYENRSILENVTEQKALNDLWAEIAQQYGVNPDRERAWDSTRDAQAMADDLDREIKTLDTEIKYRDAHAEKPTDFDIESSYRDDKVRQGNGLTDEIYQYLGNPDYEAEINDRAEREAYGGDGRGPALAKLNQLEMYQVLTQSEREQFNYLYNHNSAQEAQAYLDSLMPKINARVAAADNQMYQEAATGNPFAAVALYMGNRLVRPVAGVAGAIGMGLAALGNQEAQDPNSNFYSMTGNIEAMDQAQAQAAGKALSVNVPYFNKPLGEMLYGAVTSAVDSAMSAKAGLALGGGNAKIAENAALLIMGTEAGTSEFRQAMLDGESGTESLIKGLVGAATEIITERLGINEYLEPNLTRGLVTRILAQSGIEGLEEIEGAVINGVYDELSGRTTREAAHMANFYQDQDGKRPTMSEARGQVHQRQLREGLEAGVEGTLSGGMMVSTQGAGQTYQANRAGAHIKANQASLDLMSKIYEGMQATDKADFAKMMGVRDSDGTADLTEQMAKMGNTKLGRMSMEMLTRINESVESARKAMLPELQERLRKNGAKGTRKQAELIMDVVDNGFAITEQAGAEMARDGSFAETLRLIANQTSDTSLSPVRGLTSDLQAYAAKMQQARDLAEAMADKGTPVVKDSVDNRAMMSALDAVADDSRPNKGSKRVTYHTTDGDTRSGKVVGITVGGTAESTEGEAGTEDGKTAQASTRKPGKARATVNPGAEAEGSRKAGEPVTENAPGGSAESQREAYIRQVAGISKDEPITAANTIRTAEGAEQAGPGSETGKATGARSRVEGGSEAAGNAQGGPDVTGGKATGAGSRTEGATTAEGNALQPESREGQKTAVEAEETQGTAEATIPGGENAEAGKGTGKEARENTAGSVSGGNATPENQEQGKAAPGTKETQGTAEATITGGETAEAGKGTGETAEETATGEASGENVTPDQEQGKATPVTEEAPEEGKAESAPEVYLAIEDEHGKIEHVSVDDIDSIEDDLVAAAVKMVEEDSTLYTPEELSTMINLYEGGDAAGYIDSFNQAYTAGYYGQTLAPHSTPYLRMDTANMILRMGQDAAGRTEQVRLSTLTPKKGMTGELIMDSSVHQDALDTNQRSAIDVLGRIIKALGVNIRLYESQADESGRYTSENGKYDQSTNTISIDVHSGRNYTPEGYEKVNAERKAQGKPSLTIPQYALLKTAAHELTHYIEHGSGEGYASLRRMVVDQLSQAGYDFDTLVGDKLSAYRAAGYRLTRGGAVAEVIADGMEMMLEDPDTLAKLAKRDPGLFERMKAKLEEIAGKIKQAFFGVEATSREAKALLQKDADGILRYTEELRKAWVDALIQASQEEQPSLAEMSTEQAMEEMTPSPEETVMGQTDHFFPMPAEEEKQNSARTWEDRTLKNISETDARAMMGDDFVPDMVRAVGVMGKTGVFLSGREILETTMRSYGFSQEQIEKSISHVDSVAKWLKDVARVKFRFLELDDVISAEIKGDPATGRITASCRVKNGEYPINIDFTRICNKRLAMQTFLNDYGMHLGEHGEPTQLDTINLSPANILRMNEILRDAGYETACLGCFVEARRYHIQKWAKKTTGIWNDLVRERIKNPESYTFNAQGKATPTDEDIYQLHNELLQYDKNLKKLKKAGMSVNVRTRMLALMNGMSDENIKLLTMADLVTVEGQRNMRKFAPQLANLVNTSYGTSQPKTVDAFTPYNSEIALFPRKISKKDLSEVNFADTKFTGSSKKLNFAEVVKSIGGARSQSFSDFMVQHILDNLQKTNDLAARKLTAQAYTKEIGRAVLFPSGEKINMSVMFDIAPDEAPKGARKAEKELAGWWHAGMAEDYQAQTDKEKKYIIGDWRRAARVHEETGTTSFTQSFPWREAVAIEHDPMYSKTHGIIGVGYSYYHNKAMLADEDIPYIIPYHASGLPAVISVATHIRLAADYTSAQNTLKFQGFRAVNWEVDPHGVPSYATLPKGAAKTEAYEGVDIPVIYKGKAETAHSMKELLKLHDGDGRAAMTTLLQYMRENNLTLARSKATEGHGDFDLYGALNAHVRDNPESAHVDAANDYIAWCLNQEWIPLFYEFTDDPNYYRMVYDFSAIDLVTGKTAPQGMVTPSSDWMDAYTSWADKRKGAKEIRTGMEAWLADADYFMGQKDQYMEEHYGAYDPENHTYTGEVYQQTRQQVLDALRNDDASDEDDGIDLGGGQASVRDIIREATRDKTPEEAAEMIEASDILTQHSIREDDPPMKTIIAYKAFYAQDGKLYPPMVSNLTDEEKKEAIKKDRRKKKGKTTSKTMNSLDTPVGVWLDADVGGIAVDQNGVPLRNSRGRLRVKNDKGGDTLAFRPGWHLGEWPDAKQFNKKDLVTGEAKKCMPDDLVFARCEIAADEDYQLDAIRYGVGKSGIFERSQAGIPYVPEDGYYKYRTNVDPNTAPWYITGAMRVVEILDDDDCARICAEHGVVPDERVSHKKINLADFGLSRGPVTPTEDLEPYRKSEANRANDELLRSALEDENYRDAYAMGDINFEDPNIIKEFEINGQSVDDYRRAAETEQMSIRDAMDDGTAVWSWLYQMGPADLKTTEQNMAHQRFKAAVDGMQDSEERLEKLRREAETATDPAERAMAEGKIRTEQAMLESYRAKAQKALENPTLQQLEAEAREAIRDFDFWRDPAELEKQIGSTQERLGSVNAQIEDLWKKIDKNKGKAGVTALDQAGDRLRQADREIPEAGAQNPVVVRKVQTAAQELDTVLRATESSSKKAPKTSGATRQQMRDYGTIQQLRAERDRLKVQLDQARKQLQIQKSAHSLELSETRKKLYDMLRKEREDARAKEKLRRTLENYRKDMAKYKRMAQKDVIYLDSLIRRESDKRNIPEVAKPAVETLLKRVADMDSAGNGLAFDRATAEYLYNYYLHAMDEMEDADKAFSDIILDRLDNLVRLYDSMRYVPGMRNEEYYRRRAEAYKSIAEITHFFRTYVKNAQDLFIGNLRRDVYAANAQVLNDMPERDKKAYSGPGKGGVQAAKEAIVYNNLTPVYFFRRLRNGGLSALWDALHEGENVYGLEMRKAREKIADIQEQYHYWDWANKKGDVLEMRTGQGRTIRLTREQAMSLYAAHKRETMNGMDSHHLDEGGFVYKEDFKDGKLMRAPDIGRFTGNKLDQRDMAAIIAWLTPDQRSYVDAMVGLLSTDMARLGNETSLKLHGIKKYTEKYYYPFKSFRGNLQQRSDAGAAGSGGQDNRQKNRGFTKALTRNANNALLLEDFSETVANHVSEMITYSTMAVPIENFNKLLNVKNLTPDSSVITTRSMVELKYGKEASDYIARLLEVLNGGIRSDATEDVFGKMVSLFKRGGVTGSLSVAMQQPLSYIRAAALINPRYLISTAPDYSGTAYEEAMRYAGTAVIKDIGGFDVGVGKTNSSWLLDNEEKNLKQKATEAVNVREFDTFRERWNDITGFLPGKMDAITWGQIWKAVKKEQVAQYPDMDPNSDEFLELCGRRFNDVMALTQVYDSSLSKSLNMQSKSTYMKILTAFMNEPTLTANLLYDSFIHAKDKEMKDRIAPHTAIALTMLSAVAQAAVKGLFSAGRRKDPDKDQTLLEKILSGFASNLLQELNPLNLLPGVKDVVDVLSGDTLERTDLSILSEIVTAFENFGKGKITDAYAFVEQVAGSVAKLVGMPLKNVMRDVRAMVNIFDGVTGIDMSWFPGVGNAKRPSNMTNVGLTMQEQLNPFYGGTDKASYASRLYEAIRSGDEAQAEQYRAYMADAKKMTDSSMDYYLKQELLADYQNGRMSRDEAAEMGVRMGIFDNVKAAWNYLAKADDALAHDGDDAYTASIYGSLMEAVRTGDAARVQQEAQELIAHGTSESTVQSKIKSSIAGWYTSGDITAQEAERLLTTLTDVKDEESLYWWFDKQDHLQAIDAQEVDPYDYNPDTASYSKYGDLMDRVSAGDTRGMVSEMDRLTDHGEKEDSIKSRTIGYIGTAWMEGTIDKETATRLYKEIQPEATDNDTYWFFDNYEHKRAHANDKTYTYSRYTDLLDAMTGGGDWRSEWQRVIDHTDKGSSKSVQKAAQYNVGQRITTVYKPQLVQLVKDGKMAEAADLQALILDLYANIGYNRGERLKAVKKWYKDYVD